jgi:type II secretion system protein G
MTHFRAFTLIELLIVVAIIAILAAIAVPNFLEAQVRTKVSRVHAEHRTLSTAIETYRIDWNRYPPTPPGQVPLEARWKTITTPVAYITSIPLDPFGYPDVDQSRWWVNYPGMGPNGTAGPRYKVYDLLEMFNPQTKAPTFFYNALLLAGFPSSIQYFMSSFGPNRQIDINASSIVTATASVGIVYDPSNGTISDGDIVRTGPGGSGARSK